MQALLDTHTVLWWFTDDSRLSASARNVIGDESNEIFISAASAWEVATKQRIGKLEKLNLVTRDPAFEHFDVTTLPVTRRTSDERVLSPDDAVDLLEARRTFDGLHPLRSRR
ncbi:type II toxin-antitoxin system VapC family toxin [Phytoactinopolyspora halotolerans]|uniref:type II toxin-antitoxin system VapC family toxin n=1 Tax=Phytoactinopolyspora halotolerans TaxID=1981512 RepID=UPI0035E3FDE0